MCYILKGTQVPLRDAFQTKMHLVDVPPVPKSIFNTQKTLSLLFFNFKDSAELCPCSSYI